MAASIAGVFNCKLQNLIAESEVLLVGVGGIGCEVLKNLVLTGFGRLDIIDVDTVKISNLNRQFLFNKDSVGKAKSHVAKNSALEFNPDVNITSHFGDILNKGAPFFNKFKLVISALDNKKARSHVNRMCLICEIPLIDSGTMGYYGQVQFIKKEVSACYDCYLRPEPKAYPICTIRDTPEEAIHCIIWAKFLFNQLFGKTDEDVLRDEENDESEKLSARDWAIQNDYNPKKLFKKVFFDDITYLLNMEHLYADKKSKPVLLDKSLLDQEHFKYSHVLHREMLTLEQSCSMFWDSVTLIKEKWKKSQNKYLIWDKDDDDMMNFVVSSSNLRSAIFNIPIKTRFDIEYMADNIIPAIATSNAIISGQIVMHVLKVLQDKYEKCQIVYLRSMLNHKGEILLKDKYFRLPNPRCSMCSQKKEIILSTDLNNFMAGQLEQTVLIKKLNIKASDEIISSKITIPNEERNNESMVDKTLEVGLIHGSSIDVRNKNTNYPLKITLSNKEKSKEEDPDFEIFSCLNDFNTTNKCNNKIIFNENYENDCVMEKAASPAGSTVRDNNGGTGRAVNHVMVAEEEGAEEIGYEGVTVHIGNKERGTEEIDNKEEGSEKISNEEVDVFNENYENDCVMEKAASPAGSTVCDNNGDTGRAVNHVMVAEEEGAEEIGYEGVTVHIGNKERGTEEIDNKEEGSEKISNEEVDVFNENYENDCVMEKAASPAGSTVRDNNGGTGRAVNHVMVAEEEGAEEIGYEGVTVHIGNKERGTEEIDNKEEGSEKISNEEVDVFNENYENDCVMEKAASPAGSTVRDNNGGTGRAVNHVMVAEEEGAEEIGYEGVTVHIGNKERGTEEIDNKEEGSEKISNEEVDVFNENYENDCVMEKAASPAGSTVRDNNGGTGRAVNHVMVAEEEGAEEIGYEGVTVHIGNKERGTEEIDNKEEGSEKISNEEVDVFNENYENDCVMEKAASPAGSTVRDNNGGTGRAVNHVMVVEDEGAEEIGYEGVTVHIGNKERGTEEIDNKEEGSEKISNEEVDVFNENYENDCVMEKAASPAGSTVRDNNGGTGRAVNHVMVAEEEGAEEIGYEGVTVHIGNKERGTEEIDNKEEGSEKISNEEVDVFNENYENDCVMEKAASPAGSTVRDNNGGIGRAVNHVMVVEEEGAEEIGYEGVTVHIGNKERGTEEIDNKEEGSEKISNEEVDVFNENYENDCVMEKAASPAGSTVRDNNGGTGRAVNHVMVAEEEGAEEIGYEGVTVHIGNKERGTEEIDNKEEGSEKISNEEVDVFNENYENDCVMEKAASPAGSTVRDNNGGTGRAVNHVMVAEEEGAEEIGYEGVTVHIGNKERGTEEIDNKEEGSEKISNEEVDVFNENYENDCVMEKAASPAGSTVCDNNGDTGRAVNHVMVAEEEGAEEIGYEGVTVHIGNKERGTEDIDNKEEGSEKISNEEVDVEEISNEEILAIKRKAVETIEDINDAKYIRVE